MNPLGWGNGLVVWLLTAGLLGFMSRRWPREQRQWVAVAWGVHVLGTLAAVTLLLRAAPADSIAYWGRGATLARLLHADFGRMFPEVIHLIRQQPHMLPVRIIGSGSSTGTMAGLSGLAQWAFGPGLVTACSVLGSVSFLGRVLLMRTLVRWFPGVPAVGLVACTLMIPSVVFWSCALTKEAVAIGAFGGLIWSLDRVQQRRTSLVGWGMGAASATLLLWTKAFLLVPLAVALGFQWYGNRLARRSGRGWTTGGLVLASLLGLGAVVGLGQVVPRLSVATLAEESIDLQRRADLVQGGSDFSLGEQAPAGVGGQLRRLPLALFSGLFRPLLFEARSATMLLAALESTAYLVLVLLALQRAGAGGLVRRVLGEPRLFFVAVLALVMVAGIALSASNMGTLSRYRTPAMPLFATLVWIAGRPTRTGEVRRKPVGLAPGIR